MAYPDIDQEIIFQDTFTEPSSDTDLASHTPDTGTSWSLVHRDSGSDALNAVAASDTMKPSGNSSNNGIIYSADASYPGADYEVSCVIKAAFTGTNRGYLIVRMQDKENMYALRFTTGASATRMYKKVSGSWTALGSFKDDPAVNDVVTIRVVKNVLTYYYNNVLIDTQTDSAISAAGKAGFAMGGGAELAASTDDILSTNEIDDFTVSTVKRARTEFATSVTSMPVNLPGNLTSGKLLIAVVHDRNAATYTKPTGWNDLFSQAGGGSVGKMTGFYKITDGTEGGQATFTASTGTTAIWEVVEVEDWHGTTAPEAASTSGDVSAADPPSITPSWGAADDLFLVFAGHAAASTSAWSAAPTNYSGFKVYGASSGGAAVSLASAFRKLNASSEDPGAFTVSGSNRWWASAIIAIRPAASGTNDNAHRAAKVTGKDTANGHRGAKVTGKTTGSASRGAKVTGKDSATGSRGAKVTGQDQATGSRGAKTTGVDTDSDGRGAKVTGQDSAVASRGAKVTGTDTDADSRGAKVTGADGASASRGAKITGVDTSSSNRGCIVTGQESATGSRGAKLTGVGGLADGRGAKVTGVDTDSASRGAKVVGSQSLTGSRGAKVTGIASSTASRLAKVTGVDTTQAGRGAKVTGQDTQAASRAAKLTGSAAGTASRAAKLTGQAQDASGRNAKVTGTDQATAVRGAKVVGVDSATGSRGAKVTGVGNVNAARGAVVTGIESATGSRGAKVSGKLAASAARGAKLIGKIIYENIEVEVTLDEINLAVSEDAINLSVSDTDPIVAIEDDAINVALTDDSISVVVS